MVHHHVHVVKGAFPLEIPFNGIQEERFVGDAMPKEHFLLLLRTNAAVAEEEIQEFRFRLLQNRVRSRFQVSQIRKDALFKLFGIEDGPSSLCETKDENLDDVRAGYEELSPPEDAGNVFAIGQLVGSDGWIVYLGP